MSTLQYPDHIKMVSLVLKTLLFLLKHSHEQQNPEVNNQLIEQLAISKSQYETL